MCSGRGPDPWKRPPLASIQLGLHHVIISVLESPVEQASPEHIRYLANLWYILHVCQVTMNVSLYPVLWLALGETAPCICEWKHRLW